MNSLAALAAVHLAGGDIQRAAPALADFGAPAGRGAQTFHSISGGQFRLIDESYNANPASMRAAFAVLASAPSAHRLIAVLGDMLELGPQADALHRDMASGIVNAGIDKVYCCGQHMSALFEALPEEKRGAWAADSTHLADTLLAALLPGDAVMVKGSLGSQMGALVEAVKQRYSERAQPERTAAV